MTDLIIHPQPGTGIEVSVTPEQAGWSHVGFEVRRMQPREALTWEERDRELCLVVLTGTVRLERAEAVDSLGIRASVFDGSPAAAYLPPGERAELRATTEAEVALCWSPATSGPPAAVMQPQDLAPESRGTGSSRRSVTPILMEDRPASSLLVVEVITPAGNWSSYPPHKHDVDDGEREAPLEETYYHRLRPPTGFAVQRVYSADRSLDETLCVSDRDLVLVPRGYHAVAAPPGYDLYYLNVMAGPRRAWRVSDDPDHAWLRDW